MGSRVVNHGETTPYNLDIVPPMVSEIEQVLEALPYLEIHAVETGPCGGEHRGIGVLGAWPGQGADAVFPSPGRRGTGPPSAGWEVEGVEVRVGAVECQEDHFVEIVKGVTTEQADRSGGSMTSESNPQLVPGLWSRHSFTISPSATLRVTCRSAPSRACYTTPLHSYGPVAARSANPEPFMNPLMIP